jgi:uncharacterized membrane protein
MADQRDAAVRRRGETDRVKAFTDAVIAIIMTILVLEIGVPPDLSDERLVDALDETWPELIAWIISFLIVGMYWVWHRDLFNQMRLVDEGVVWLNLLFLVPLALVPFAASVLGEYPDEAIGMHVYGGILIATAVMRGVLYAYVVRRPRLLYEAPTMQRRRIGGLLAIAPIGVYLIAMLVAGASTRLSLVLFLLVPGSYLLLIAVLRRHPSTREEAQDFG